MEADSLANTDRCTPIVLTFGARPSFHRTGCPLRVIREWLLANSAYS